MSVESTFKNYIDIDLPPNKSLQVGLSQRESESRPRLSSKSTSKLRPPPKSRSRTISAAAAETNTTNVVDLLLKPNKIDEKSDRRYSDLKSAMENQDHSTLERRNSTPQLHLGALIPHAFRNPKSHQRTYSKDETSPVRITINHVNASANHLGDTMTTGMDPPFALRSPTRPMRTLRLVSSVSSEPSVSSQSEDFIPSTSFIFEETAPEARSAELFITESHTPICVSETYHEHFYEHFHTNYYGEYDFEGPFIASVRCSYQKTSLGEVCEARAIIRTPYRNCDVSDVVNANNENNILQMLFNKSNLPPIRAYGTIGDPKANEKIYQFDKANDERFNCKIGVIYQRVNQTCEYEIFSNDYPSMDMLNFLDILAERVSLKGFQKYRGDLDTKDDLHGEYSYYTNYRNHEIMFNVAPFVPSSKANGQCIERKALVGNAFVCIVFQEAGALFSPDFISGRVIQVYITVQPIINDDGLYYKIGVWRRNDITSVVDPPGGIFKYDRSFVSYFLTLLLNAVNVAVESPSLRTRIYEQRLRIKHEELKKLSYLFSLGPILDFTADVENNHHQLDTRSSLRTDNSLTTSMTTASESVSSNPGRISPTPSKKKGFSRKIFGVFSSRSGSMSTSTPPAPIVLSNNDATPSSPQLRIPRDGSISSGRINNPSNKENLTRQRSIKSKHAPIPPPRPRSFEIPQNLSVQSPSSLLLLNPFLYNTTQNNQINTAALNIPTRNRSNSSPEDTINNNKPQSNSASSKVAEDVSTTTASSSSGEDDSEDDSSTEEKPPTRRASRYS